MLHFTTAFNLMQIKQQLNVIKQVLHHWLCQIRSGDFVCHLEKNTITSNCILILPLCLDELPQTVTIKDSVSAAPADTSVKAEPLESQEKQSEGSTSSPQLPPTSITVKTEVKKEEPEEEDGRENDEEEDDRPCTKMTMRLRRNISNPQCVSKLKDAPG